MTYLLLVVINTKTAHMRRYVGRRLTHKLITNDSGNYPLSAAYLSLINVFRIDPNHFLIESGPESAA